VLTQTGKGYAGGLEAAGLSDGLRLGTRHGQLFQTAEDPAARASGRRHPGHALHPLLCPFPAPGGGAGGDPAGQQREKNLPNKGPGGAQGNHRGGRPHLARLPDRAGCQQGGRGVQEEQSAAPLFMDLRGRGQNPPQAGEQGVGWRLYRGVGFGPARIWLILHFLSREKKTKQSRLS